MCNNLMAIKLTINKLFMQRKSTTMNRIKTKRLMMNNVHKHIKEYRIMNLILHNNLKECR